MFGFRVGEERWYGLEPVEVLRPGEFIRWRIRLDRIGGALIDPIGVFVLENDTATFLSGSFNPGAKREISSRVELTVNRFGFPLEIDYEIDVADPTSRESRRDRHFLFDADGFTDGDIYLEEDGTILRIDTRYRDRQNTYVRLLLPSEY